MTCSDIRPALSDLVDGTLVGEARTRVEAHLETCEACRALFADLKGIRQAGRALPRAAAPDRLWTRVQAAVAAEMDAARETGQPRDVRSLDDARAARKPRRLGVAWSPAWARLAAAALVVLAVGVAWLVLRGNRAPAAENNAAHATATPAVQTVDAEVEAMEQHYTKAIAALEQVKHEGQSALDAQTMAVLDKNSGVLDQAIHESQAAVKAQPSSEEAQASLFDALQRKVNLLKDTVALINEMRKGDQAGTARIAGSLGK